MPLLKEHKLYRCYINKDKAIALFLEKGIITTTDLKEVGPYIVPLKFIQAL